MYILDELMCLQGGNKVSYMPFAEAYDIHLGFQDVQLPSRESQVQFRDAILHDKYGLCVYYISAPSGSFILLRSDDVDLSTFFGKLLSVSEHDKVMCCSYFIYLTKKRLQVHSDVILHWPSLFSTFYLN